ncbi:MAG: hypothetical protein AABZ60_05695, partial [Planctomycetota bacterium]
IKDRARVIRDGLEQEIDSGSEIISGEGLRTMGGMGTPGYMPPEQAENASQVTAESDIYALGKMLRECYLLLSPHEEIKMLKSKAGSSQKKEDLKKIENALPSDILAIIAKATEVEPQNRYESVKKMANDIEAYLHHRTVSVREYSFWELFYKWSQRNKIIVLLFILTLLLILSFTSYSFWSKKRELHLKSQKLYGQFVREKKEADNHSSETRQEKSKKTESSLKALTYLNQAIKLQPENSQMNKEKVLLSIELFDLVCENQQYLLAYSIAKELDNLIKLNATDGINKETSYIDKIKENQDKMLLDHQKDLKSWLDELTPIKDKSVEDRTRRRRSGIGLKIWVLEDAIYEISKMKEPEIFQRLLEVLKEGADYYSSEKIQSSQMNRFYQNILEIVSHIVTPENGEEMMDLIKKILSAPEKANFNSSEKTYLKELMKVLLENTRSRKYAETMKILALKLGSDFWKDIDKYYQKRLSEEQ